MSNIGWAARQLEGEDWYMAGRTLTRQMIERLPPEHTRLASGLQNWLAAPKVPTDVVIDQIEPELIRAMGWEHFEAQLRDVVEQYRLHESGS